MTADSDNLAIFTFSAGRTGTGYLARLLAEAGALAVHEGQLFGGFGWWRPDISHLHRFATFPLVDGGGLEAFPKGLGRFWANKLANTADRLPADGQNRVYAETSHVNAKAGLLEWLVLRGRSPGIRPDVRFTIVHLTRDPRKTVLSLAARGDLKAPGNMWMWYLAPDYPNNLVEYGPFAQLRLGTSLWYLSEMEQRANHYRRLAGPDSFDWIDVGLEEITDEQGARRFVGRFGLELAALPGKTNATRAWPTEIEDLASVLDAELAYVRTELGFLQSTPSDCPKPTR